jgi:hypothetical protein
MGIHHVAADAAALCDVDANHLANAAKRVTQGTPFLCKDLPPPASTARTSTR